MSSQSRHRRRKAPALFHPLLYSVVVSAALSLYALQIAVIEGSSFLRYLGMVLLLVSCAFYGQVILHRIVMGVAGYGRNNIAASLPIAFAFQLIVFAGLIQWRNTRVVYPILHNKLLLAVAVLVVLLAASFAAIWVARRLGINIRTRRPVRAISTVVLVAIAAVTATTYFPTAASGAKNIVLITIDSWRYDHRNSVREEMVTPNVSALESVGLVYDNYQTHAPYTWTALSSIMTSLESPFHGVRINGQVLGNDNITLAEVLSNNGYQCFAAADIGLDLMGLRQGFEPQSRPRELSMLGLYAFNMILGYAFPDFFERHCFDTNNSMPTTMQGLEFVRRARGKKFFMWLHYYDEPHIPYVAPDYYVDLYNHGKSSWVTDDAGIVYALRGKPKYLPKIEGKTLTAADLDYLKGFYKAEVSAMDRQLGMVLSSLHKNGLFDNTLIVLTSDHGEDFGERDQFTHGSNLYKGLLHVPMVVKLPGQSESRRVADMARGIDIAPSILKRMGIGVPEEFHGRDVASPADSTAAADDATWCFAESMAYGMGWPYDKYGFSYTNERYKYISLPLEEQQELYDLESDPGETVNIAETHPDIVAGIHEDLLEYFELEDLFGLVPLDERLVIGEKQLKMLKTLGYID